MSEQFCNNIKILSGERAIENLPFEINAKSVKKPMLICDEISYRLGYLSELLNVFNNNDIKFSAIVKKIADKANAYDCERLIKIFNNSDCDSIVVLGGESAIITAKCIKLMAKDGNKFLSAYKNQRISSYSLMEVPLFVVPIGLGCGIEASKKVRVPDTNNNMVYEMSCEFARTNVVVCDKKMLDVMPVGTIADTCLSSLAKAMYGYLNSNNNFMAKSYFCAGMQLLKDYFLPYLTRNGDKSKALQIMTANIIISCAYGEIPDNFFDKLCHVISDRYEVSFNKIYLSLFPYVLFDQNHSQEDLQRLLLYVIGEKDYSMTTPKGRVQKLEIAIRELYNTVGVLINYKIGLTSLGITQEILPEIAQNYIQSYGDSTGKTADDIINLLSKAL